MAESKLLLDLLTRFPSKTEDYLIQQLRKCNNNLSATIEAINNDVPEDSGSFRNFFQSIFNGFGKLCCGTSQATQNNDVNARGDLDFMDIKIGEELARNLVNKFGDSDLILPTDYQPVVQIPVALGRQLYISYVESAFHQQEIYDKIAEDLIKEDEEFAKELQNEDNIRYRTLTHFGKFQKEMRQPDLPSVHVQQNLKDTNKILSAIKALEATPQGWKESSNRIKQSGFIDSVDAAFEDDDLENLDKSANYYREQAAKHSKKRNEFYRLAKNGLKVNDRQRAQYYHQKAKQETELINQANKNAAALFLIENSQNRKKNTIDLHHLYVKEAVEALDNFLDKEILLLEDKNKQTKTLEVITGRGKHSRDGIPRIKPAVIERLRERSLRYSELNPGLLRVQIFKHSYLTNES